MLMSLPVVKVVGGKGMERTENHFWPHGAKAIHTSFLYLPQSRCSRHVAMFNLYGVR